MARAEGRGEASAVELASRWGRVAADRLTFNGTTGAVGAKVVEATSSSMAMDRGGDGERILGGRGGGGEVASMLNIARGGGGSGPAFACRPGS